MINLLSTLAITALVANPAYAETPVADETQVVEAIKAMYVAATNDDLAHFNTVAAPEFYAFDGGKRFTGDIAWITYVNRGSVEDGSGQRDLTWLESAVLRKDAGNWRIHFFHSTRAP